MLVEQSSSVQTADVATAEETYGRSLIEADRDRLGSRIAARTAYLAAIAAARQGALDSGDLEFVRQLDERHATIETELQADRNDLVRREHELAGDARVAVLGDGFVLKTLQNSAQAYSNRPYLWENVPENIEGWNYTRIDGGDTPESHIEVLESGGVSGTAETMKLGWTFRSEFSFTWSMQSATPR